MTTDALKAWSQILFWLTITLPILGAGAAIGRYYVDRRISGAIFIDRLDNTLKRF
jgi:hypothetical protein